MTYILEAPEYIAALVLGFALFYRKKPVRYLLLAVTIALLFFFREWTPPHEKADPTILYSPCDGVISDIQHHPDGSMQVCIFLNIHNIHAQYAPFDCSVESIEHKAGTFHPAYLLEKSQYNERMEYILKNAQFGTVKFVQIAGQIARSCVSFVKEAQRISAYQPVGMIKLGSRCDIYVRDAVRYNPSWLKVGTRVHIGDPLFYAS